MHVWRSRTFSGRVSDVGAAERTLKAALAIDSQNNDIHRTLALLYLSSRRVADAEPHFKALASEPGGQLALADYYTGAGDRDKAMTVLRSVRVRFRRDRRSSGNAAHFGHRSSVGRKAEAYKIVNRIVQKTPKYAEARVAKARMLLMDKKADEAAKEAQEAVKLAAGSVAAQ